MYVTYDLPQQTRGGGHALYPKVQRVYIAGQIKDWQVGNFITRTGKEVHGVKIDYQQTRAGYQREGYTAHRGGTQYHVAAAKVGGATSHFARIVEVPQEAENVKFHGGKLPRKYQHALQDVRRHHGTNGSVRTLTSWCCRSRQTMQKGVPSWPKKRKKETALT
jgi:hypothetical protein